jgi:hypothetical protein
VRVECPTVRRAGLRRATKPAQQLSARGVEQVVAGKAGVQRFDRGQRGGWPSQLAERHAPVKRHHRGWLQIEKLIVERHDSAPIGRRIGRGGGVHGHDRGLQLVRARLSHALGSLDELNRSLDRHLVPPRSILVGQQDQRSAGAEACLRARQVELHEREQADGLRLIGHQPDDQRGEPFGIGRQGPTLGDGRA